MASTPTSLAPVLARRTPLARAVTTLLIVIACIAPLARASAPDASAGAPRTTPRATLNVVVSIPPLQGLVEPMLRDPNVSEYLTVNITTLIPAGVSEHGYEIPPSKLASLSRADVVIIVGLGLEPQVERFLKDRPRAARRVVIAADVLGLADDNNDGHSDHAHQHAADGSCCPHHGTDPHVWLDPQHAQTLVGAIAENLRVAAGNTEDLSKRLWLAEESLRARLAELDRSFARTLKPASPRTLVVGHDAWGYLAKRYDLTTVAIKGLTATEPTPASLEAATRAIKEQGVTTVFVEPQLSHAAGKKIAEAAGAKLALLDPLGDGDYFKLMTTNLAAIARAFNVPVLPGTEDAAPASQAATAPATSAKPEPR